MPVQIYVYSRFGTFSYSIVNKSEMHRADGCIGEEGVARSIISGYKARLRLEGNPLDLLVADLPPSGKVSGMERICDLELAEVKRHIRLQSL